MKAQDFMLAIYESDLSDSDKEYLLGITEAVSASSVAVGGVVFGHQAFRATVMFSALKKYEKEHPDMIKFSAMRKEIHGDKKPLGTNIHIDNTFYAGNEPIFHMQGHINTLTLKLKDLQIDAKVSEAEDHKDYYWAAYCQSMGYTNEKKARSWAEKIVYGNIFKKKEKPVKESSMNLFSNDTAINAGLMAGIAGQTGASVFSGQERNLRNELQQIQTQLQFNGSRMNPQQQNLLMARSGVILDELARAERRKGTATAIRNAALMIAAAAKIRKMIENDRLYGPDNPDMLQLIGGLPEIR